MKKEIQISDINKFNNILCETWEEVLKMLPLTKLTINELERNKHTIELFMRFSILNYIKLDSLKENQNE